MGLLENPVQYLSSKCRPNTTCDFTYGAFHKAVKQVLCINAVTQNTTVRPQVIGISLKYIPGQKNTIAETLTKLLEKCTVRSYELSCCTFVDTKNPWLSDFKRSVQLEWLVPSASEMWPFRLERTNPVF